MKTLLIYDDPRPVTLGELCEALTERTVPAIKDGQYYNVSKRDVSSLAETILARKARKECVETQSVTV